MSRSAIRLLPDGDPSTGMSPTNAVARDNLLEGDPTEQGHISYTSADGRVTAGVWECTPCKERLDPYGVDEICTVLSGSVTVTDDDGNAETFTTGDSFVMARDFRGTWHITETLKKYWMIVEPAEGS